jgi:hypothetical protein
MEFWVEVFSVFFFAIFIVHILSVIGMHIAQYKFSMYSKKVFFKAHLHLLATALIVTAWFVVMAKGGLI